MATTLLAASFALGRAADDQAGPPTPAPNETKPAPPSNAPPAAVPNDAAATAPAASFPPKLGLPPLLDQVVRLSKSGADEAVIKAYIEKAAPEYRMTGNDILELQNQGVSKNVILALVESSKAATPPVELAVATNPEPATIPAPLATAPLTPDAGAFYDALAPYGTWTVEPDYGWVWQPTAVVVNPSWSPYLDNGSWLWSDSGWYWNSYYSWGWAPFHYGRWYCPPGRGWLWYPDQVWGPSWVCWRNSATWCGWAPLPPGACFTAGFGWSYWGVSVGTDCNFGIASAHFTFVAHDRFTDRHVGYHRAHGHEANTAYAHSRVANNYSMGENNRVFNHGVGREQIAAARGRPVPEVSVSDAMPHRSPVGGTRAVASTGSRSTPVAGRAVGSQPSRAAAVSSATPQSRASFAGTSSGTRAMANPTAANRAVAPQQSRGTYASAAPRANPSARASFTPQSRPQSSRAATPVYSSPTRSYASRSTYTPQRSYAPQRSFNSSRSAPAARAYSAPTMQRSFSSRPTMSAPASRSSASFGGASRGGGSMSTSRGGGAGGRR